MAIKKIRLDKLLVDRGVTPTLEKARALILARAVKVNETYPDKAGELVPVDSEIHIKGEDNPYVSRGGLKLAGALKEFNLNVEKIVALDVGASTGGFTDCLLQSGAKKSLRSGCRLRPVSLEAAGRQTRGRHRTHECPVL